MKKHTIYPLLALLGGLACFTLRSLQIHSGFEADTGLPVPGDPFARLLPAVLVLLAVILYLLARRFPEKRQGPAQSFPDCFFTTGAAAPALLVAGMFAWFAAGAYQFYAGAAQSHSLLDIFLGGLTLLAAACWFPVISVCRRHLRLNGTLSPTMTLNGNLLLVPVVFLVLLLVVTYRANSVNPALQAYYPQLMALVFLILAFFLTSSFAFQDGQSRRFLFCSMMAVVLCLTALADRPPLFFTLLLAGALLAQLGLMFLRVEAFSWQETHASETAG